MTQSHHLCVWEEKKQEKKTMMIYDHLLSFTRVTKAKKTNKHEDDNSMLLSSCLKGARIRGGNEDNDNFLLLSSFVFHRSDRGQKKFHKDDNTKLSSLWLRGVKIRRRRWRWWRSTWLLSSSIYLYNILGWSSFPSIRPIIRPSKFLIPEEEDDGTGGG
jgi:hypothetical protein